MKINIRDKSTGKPITAVDVHPFGLVSVLKTVISSKINYPPDSQTIFYRGRQLDDARRIDFYNLHGNATVDLVVMKINGGPGKTCSEYNYYNNCNYHSCPHKYMQYNYYMPQ